MNNSKFAQALGIAKDGQDILDTGSNHRFDCTCGICKKWWQNMGPECPGQPYGPFTIEQIEDGTEAGEACKRARLQMEDED